MLDDSDKECKTENLDQNIFADEQVIYYVKTFTQRMHFWDN